SLSYESFDDSRNGGRRKARHALFEYEVVIERVIGERHARHGWMRFAVRGEAPHECAHCTEYDVALQMLGIIREDLGHERLVTRRRDHEMQVGRSIGMAALQTDQIADRAVGRNRIPGGPDRSE